MNYLPEELWPLRYLLWGILERAVLDAVGKATDYYFPEVRQKCAEEALDWIYCDDPSLDDRFTFHDICHNLSLCPNKVRGIIAKGVRGEIDFNKHTGKGHNIMKFMEGFNEH